MFNCVFFSKAIKSENQKKVIFSSIVSSKVITNSANKENNNKPIDEKVSKENDPEKIESHINSDEQLNINIEPHSNVETVNEKNEQEIVPPEERALTSDNYEEELSKVCAKYSILKPINPLEEESTENLTHQAVEIKVEKPQKKTLPTTKCNLNFFILT